MTDCVSGDVRMFFGDSVWGRLVEITVGVGEGGAGGATTLDGAGGCMEVGSDVGAGAGCVGTDVASAASFLSSDERRCSKEFRRLTDSCRPIELSLAVRSCTRIYATIAIMGPAISKPTMRTTRISILSL